MRLVGREGLHTVEIDPHHCIVAITPQTTPPSPRAITPESPHTLDFQGDWLSLGAVDLQINGALGLAFPDLTVAQLPQLQRIAEFLWDQGVDGFCPTLVTSALPQVHQALHAIQTFINTTPTDGDRPQAQILGVHLEGPCLNPAKRGAHPQEFLRPLTLPELRSLLGDYGAIVKIVTLAPELDRGNEVIPFLVAQGITVSLGHSLATAAQAKQAFQQGATMITHAFNAMPGLHHREPGLLGEAVVNPAIACGLIADGHHVVPTMIDWLLRASNYDQGVFLVSDALAPLGLPDGVYPWDQRQITITQGTARLDDGTLAGTTRSLLAGALNLLRWNLVTLPQAISLSTDAPRRAVGLPPLAVGVQGNFLRWPQNLSAIASQTQDPPETLITRV